MTDYGLSPQQLLVIDSLSSGATMTHAAEQAGIHRNTLSNWRRNLLPFQHALAHAQYDRALLYREKLEELAETAFNTIQQILADPQAPASIRLKAALAVIQTITTPPAPKKQVMLDIEKITVTKQTEPVTEEQFGTMPSVCPESPRPAPVHNSAQSPRTVQPKIGRNEACPCGSGNKYKRCCLDQPIGQPAEVPLAAAA